MTLIPQPMMNGNGEGGTILVADDDPSTRQLIVDALLGEGGFNIIEAVNGAQALQFMKKSPCDLVITDVMMPVMGGMELLNQIMELDPLIHVIVMTGYPTIDLSVSAMKGGAVEFLVKPFNIDDLLYKAKVHLKGRTYLQEKTGNERLDFALKSKINELSTRSYIYDMIEGTGSSTEHIFQEIVDTALNVAGGDSCSILLYDEDGSEFHPKVKKDLCSDFVVNPLAPALHALLEQVVQSQQASLFSIGNFSGTPTSFILAPLKIRNRVFGILSLSRRKNGVQFTATDLQHITSLTNRASLNVENNILYESTYAYLMNAVKSLAASIQARDHYTESHSVRVTDSAVRIATALGCSENDIESLKICGMMHDVGKIAVPDNILLKPGQLTAEEYDIIKRHPETGESIIKPLLIFDQERIVIRHHHERIDGRGYPDGLADNHIPLLSRILSVADSFDAMTNNRPYRRALSVECAVGELEKNARIQFDKEVVQCFLHVIQGTAGPLPRP